MASHSFTRLFLAFAFVLLSFVSLQGADAKCTKGKTAPTGGLAKRRINHANYEYFLTASSSSISTSSTNKATTTTKTTTTSSLKAATTSSTISAPQATSTTLQTTLVTYNDYVYSQYASKAAFAALWVKKCKDTVGPKGFHHVTNVTDIGNGDVYVYCHGVPKDPETQEFYTAAQPYNSTCVQGPQTEFTSQIITKLEVQRIGPLGTMQQVKGC